MKPIRQRNRVRIKSYAEYLNEMADIAWLERLSEQAIEGKTAVERQAAVELLYLELNGNHGDG